MRSKMYLQVRPCALAFVTGCLMAGASQAQVLQSRPAAGMGPDLAPAAGGMAAAPQSFMRVKKAPAGSEPPSTDPHDFAGVWMSELVQQQVVPTVKPELVGKVQTPQPSGFATPNIESRKCHPSPYFQGTSSYPMQIVQTDKQINFIFEENRRTRRIYIDGKLPKNPTPSHFGHSVGHWEGDTLVVETVGLKHAIDYQLVGDPNIRVVEKMKKVDEGSALDIEVTYYNDKQWATPGTMHVRYQWRPDLSLMEVICEEFSDNFGRGYDTLR
ncbi:MAG: hypothetical protein QM808_14430 [Steroidobacteraceae bacterium]